MISERVRGVVSTTVLAGITLLMAPAAHAVGIAVALAAFLLGAAVMFFGQHRMGAPGSPSRTYPWLVVGAVLAPVIVAAAGALGLTELPALVVAAGGGFATGALLVFTLRLWPALRRQ